MNRIVFAWTVVLACPISLGAQTRTDHNGDPLPAGAVRRFGSIRWQHPTGITGSALSPDGRHLATTAQDSVAIWETRTGKKLQHFPFHDGISYSGPKLTFSPDGKYLGYVRNGSYACVWQVATGKQLFRSAGRLAVEGLFRHCCFSIDGKRFLLLKDRKLIQWDLARKTFGDSFDVKQAARLVPDGTSYMSLEERKWLAVRDVRTGKEKFRLPVSTADNGVEDGVAFSPDSKRLALVHAWKEIQIRDAASGKLQQRFSLPKGTIDFKRPTNNEYRLRFSADGRELILGTMLGIIYRWDLTTGRALARLHKHRSMADTCFALSDGKTLLSTGADGLIRQWDARTGRALSEPASYVGQIVGAISADGRYVAVGDERGRLDLWDVRSGKRLRRWSKQGPAVRALVFSPDSRTLTIARDNHGFAVRQVPSGKNLIASLPAKLDLSGMRKMFFNRDGSRLFLHGPQGQLACMSPTLRKRYWLKDVLAISRPTDNNRLLAVLPKQQMAVLDGHTGKVVRTIPFKIPEGRSNPPHGSICVSADGRLFAIAIGIGDVLVGDSRSGTVLHSFRAVDPSPLISIRILNYSHYEVTDLAFSTNGCWLIATASDNSIRLWEIGSGQPLLRLPGHEGGTTRAALTPDGRHVFTTGNNGQAYLWTLRPPQVASPTPSLTTLWTKLADKDAKKAYAALWQLTDAKGVAEFLRKKIAPVATADPARVQKLIDDLGNKRFRTRSKAMKALKTLGEVAKPALEKNLAKRVPLEVHLRLRLLFEHLQIPPTLTELRRRRAVQVLEFVGTKAARHTLRVWAGGAEGVRLTEEARRALHRLQRRP